MESLERLASLSLGILRKFRPQFHSSGEPRPGRRSWAPGPAAWLQDVGDGITS